MTESSVDHALDWLSERAVAGGLPWEERWRAPLGTLMRWTGRFSAKTNLVGDATPMGIAREHLLEAFTVAAAIRRHRSRWQTLVDVGAGAGMEVLTLGVIFPDASMCALEPRRKRADFIEVAGDAIGVSVDVVRGKLPDWTPATPFDVAVSRATFAPARWLELAAPLVSSQGLVLVHGAADTAEDLPCLDALSVPGGGDHQILVYQPA